MIMDLQAANVVTFVTLVCLAEALPYAEREASCLDKERTRRSISGEAIKILLRGAKRFREDESTIWYRKHGGYTRAFDDFAKTHPADVKYFARGLGQFGHVGNRQIFIIRQSKSSGTIGVVDETTHFQRKDIYIDYIE